jgi:hypothetical protein
MEKTEHLGAVLDAVRRIQAVAPVGRRTPTGMPVTGQELPSGDASHDALPAATTSITAFVSWAHSHSSWTAQKSKDWQSQVATFAVTLRQHFGIDADVDLFHADQPTDWTRYGPTSVVSNDMTIVVMSEAWAERWSGTNKPTEGAGAAAEADTLKGLFQDDQVRWQQRLVIALFPEVPFETVPPDLRRVARIGVEPNEVDSYEGLVRLLTGQPQYVKPPLGPVPFLPPSDGNADLAIARLRAELETTVARMAEIKGDTSNQAKSERRALSSKEATLRGVLDAAMRN